MFGGRGVLNEFQSVFRLTCDFRHDTLLLSTFGLTVAYDISDDLKLTGGIIAYQDENKALFRSIGDNDRLFAELRYSF